MPAHAAGCRGRAATVLVVAGWQVLGLFTPAALLLALIGLEEVTATPLVPERIALAAAGLSALQLIAAGGTLVTAVWRTRRRS